MKQTPKTALLSGLFILGLGWCAATANAQTKKPVAKKAPAKTASSAGFKKLKGIKYKIVKDVPGKNAAIGDVVEFHILVKIDTMVIADSRKQNNGKPAGDRVEEVQGTGQWKAVLPMLCAGDSAIVEISCDTLLKVIPSDQVPSWMVKGKTIKVYLSIVSVKSMEEYTQEMQAKAAVQGMQDDKILQDYFAKNSIKAQKTESGVYYTIQQPGMGDKIVNGQTVTMNYTGKTLDGNVFDSNVDSNFHHPQPFDFVPGTGGVIKGWEDAALVLNKGTKATLYIPSQLAYGAQSPSPAIPANSILIFNVEVVDVKAEKK